MSTWPVTVTQPRSLPFGRLRRHVYEALQIDPAAGPSDASVQGFITREINAAYRYAWNFCQWEESKVFQQFTIQNHPVTGTPFLPRNNGLDQIADVYSLWTTHPLADPTAQKVGYRVGSDGYYLDTTFAGSSVWAICRQDAPRFTNTAYDNAATYAPGDEMLYTDGNCYLCLTGVTATPPTAGGDANWRPIVVLYLLSEAVVSGAIALRNQGQEKFANESVLKQAMADLLYPAFVFNTRLQEQSCHHHHNYCP